MYKTLEHNIPSHSQHKYTNEIFEGMEIDLKVKDAVHVFQNCEFKDCYVHINSSSRVTSNILSSNTWLGCLFDTKKELSLSTIESDFIECSFKGKWSGRIKGNVENCDFSEAELINFAFYDIETVEKNKFSCRDTVIIEKAGTHSQEIKKLLSGSSMLWLHIRPDIGLFVFDIAKHKDSIVLNELLSKLSYVKGVSKA